MTPNASIIAAVTGLAAAAIAFGWHGIRVRHRAEAARGEWTRQGACLDERVRHMAAKLKKDRQAVMRGPPSPSSTALSTRPPVERNLAQLLADDPALLDLHLRSFRDDLGLRFGAIYRIFGLSPEQIEKFEALATAHEGETMALRARALSQGVGPSDPGISALRDQNNARFQDEVTSAIGAAAFQELDRVGRLKPAQALVTDIDSTMIVSQADPLTADQAWQVAQVLANSSAAYQGGGTVDLYDIDWRQAAGQMAAILSPAQLQALQTETQLARTETLLREFYSRPGSTRQGP